MRGGIMKDIRHRGPHLGVLASIYVILKIASVFPVSAFGSKAPYFPGLHAPADKVAAYFGTHGHAVALCAFLQVGSAIPFGILAASLMSRLRFFGVNVSGVYIAFFGGMMAAIDELFSGAVISVMAQPMVAANGALVQALHYLAVALGGPGFTMPFGLLMAGVSVVGGFRKLLPKWIVALGLVLALAGELSWLSMVLPKAEFLIPL